MNFNDLNFDDLNSNLDDLQAREEALYQFNFSLLTTADDYEDNTEERDAANKASRSAFENVLNSPEKNNPVYPTRDPSFHQPNQFNLGNAKNNYADMIYNNPLYSPISPEESTQKTLETNNIENNPDLGGSNTGKKLQSNNQIYPESAPESNELPFQNNKFPSTSTVASRSWYKDPFSERSPDLSTTPLSLNNTSATSLPSIVSWGIGNGERLCSSNSQSPISLASSSSSKTTEAAYYKIHSSRSQEWKQSSKENSELSAKFYHLKDYKSSSYSKEQNHQRISDNTTTFINESGLKSGNDMNTKCEEARHRYRNRVNPYPANRSYPSAVSTERKYIEADVQRLQTEDLPQRLQRKHIVGLSQTTSPSGNPRLGVKFNSTNISIQRSPAKRSFSSSEQFHIKKSRQFSVKQANVVSPRKILLHKVVNCSLAFNSHPLFPLLRDLVVAEQYYDKDALHISSLLKNLPSSTSDLISVFFRRNTDVANTYEATNNLSYSTESVMKDVLAYAHRCLLEKLKWQEQEITSARVRSPTLVPLLQTLCVNSPQVAKGNPIMPLNQKLHPYSQIPSAVEEISPPT